MSLGFRFGAFHARRFPNYDQLSIAAKLRLAREIWNDIAASNEPFPIEAWDRMELERRVAEAEAHPEELLTLEEMWRRVDETRG
ncbi:addiction module protein [Lacipirellula sp.]|uniref:addiction module protein n=1 Tax=Lacipirellula sp. TaxID=2691419 RepID=UPI003D0F7CE2